MVLSTGALRTAYAPPCHSGKGSLYLAAYGALDAWMKKYQYRVRQPDTGAYACRPITGGTGYSLHAYGPADKFQFWTGVSIATSLAVDINWQSNPYGPRLITDMPRGMVDAIEAVRTNSGQQVWRWGGYYTGNKDAMHYEIVCTPAALRSGINPATLPQSAPTPPTPTPPSNPTTPVEDEEVATIVWIKERQANGTNRSVAYHVAGVVGKHIPTTDGVNALKALGVKESNTSATALDQTFKDTLALLDGPLKSVS